MDISAIKSWCRHLLISLVSCLLVFGPLQSHAQNKLPLAPAQLVAQAQESYDRGNFSQSIRLLQQAKQNYRSQDKPLQQAQVLSLLSLAWQKVGAEPKAEQNLADSFALASSVEAGDLQNRVLAQIWHTQGQLQFWRGKNNQALADWQKSEKLYRLTEDHIGMAGSLLAQAQALEKMGFYYRACNHALEVLNHADFDCIDLAPSQIKEITQPAIEKAPPLPLKLYVSGLTSAGNSLLLMGKLSTAQTLITAAQKLNSQPNLQPNSQLSPPAAATQAKILLSLGNVHKAIALRSKARGDTRNFRRHHQQAVNFYQATTQISLERFSPIIAQQYRRSAQVNQLNLLLTTQDFLAAQQLVTQIDSTHRDRNIPAQSTELYLEIKFARCLEQLKQQGMAQGYSWQDVAKIYQEIIVQAQSIENSRLQSYALGYLGQLDRQHDLDFISSSQKLIEQALHLAQADQALEIAYRWQWRLGQIYGQQGQRQQAIESYQAALDSLEDLRSDLAALTREIQFDFKEQIEPVYREFADLLLTTPPGQPESDSETKMALDVIEALQVAELDNYFQDACTTYEPRDIEQIDQAAAVIYTIILPDRLEVIMTKGKSEDNQGQVFQRHTQAISEAQLAATVEQLRQYITEPDQLLKVQQISAQIYDWLIMPFEPELSLQTPQTLVFVLDNILQNIPMSALYDGQQYLLEKYAIAVTPGLRLLTPEVNQGIEQNKLPFLAGGISKALQINEQKFSALNHVEEELNIFSQSKVLLNHKFTAAELLKQLNSSAAARIHIATHGQFSSDPDQTFLLLWQQLLTIRNFSKLLLNRRQRIVNPIDLLVLSSCDTATGDRRGALGLAGIAVRSGAASTVATLWQISDRSTAQVMKNFYLELDKNQGKAEALRQAQLKLWQTQDKDWQIPAFWSAYIVIGNWQ